MADSTILVDPGTEPEVDGGGVGGGYILLAVELSVFSSSQC
jgi:hypothetical protein